MRFPMIPNPFDPKDFTSSLICSSDAGDGGSGQSGGGGAGAGAGTGGLTDEARDLIIRTVNASVTSQLSRKLPQAIESGMGPVNEKLDKLISAAPQPPAGGQPPTPPAGGQSPEMKAMLDRQKVLENQLRAEKDAREAQAEAAKASKRDQAVQEVLAKTGVEPLRMRGAMAELGGRIKMRDDGTPYYWTNERGFDEDLGLEEGVKKWADTDVGKSYLAPKDVAGSGASQPGRGAGPRPGATPSDPKVAKAQRIAQARQDLRGNVAKMLNADAAVHIGGGGNAGE